MNALKRFAIFSAEILENTVRLCIWLYLFFACTLGGLMLIDWFHGLPAESLDILLHFLQAAILYGLLLALITLVKWAWRKHLALNGRAAA